MSSLTQSFIGFVKKLFLFSVAVGILFYAIRYSLPERWKTPALPYLLPFFFIVNSLVHYVLLKGTEKKFSRFVNYYLAGSFLKLLLFMIVLLLYVFSHKADALAFTLTFFLLYVCFTVFEITALLNHKSSSSGENKSR